MCQSSVLLARTRNTQKKHKMLNKGLHKWYPSPRITGSGTVQSVQWLATGWICEVSWFDYRFLSSVKCPVQVSDPLSPLFFSQGVKFSMYETRHSPHLVPKLRISGITSVLPLPLYVSMTCTRTTLPENGSYSSFVTGTRNNSGDRVFVKGTANIKTPQTAAALSQFSPTTFITIIQYVKK